MRERSPGSERQQKFHVFDADNQQGRCGSGAPPFGDYFHSTGQFLQSIQRESPIVFWVLVKWMTERSHQMRVAARSQDTTDLAHDLRRLPNRVQANNAFPPPQ